MERFWFIYHDNFVQGPLDLKEVDAALAELKDMNSCLVWWRGQTEWVPGAEWKEKLPRILQELTVSTDKKAFYLDYQGDRVGPLSIKEIVEKLKPLKSLDHVRLWSNESRRWQSVYDVGPLCEALGVTRRATPRVPLVGSCTIQKDDLRIMAPLLTVSLAGMGARLDQNVPLQGVVTVTLRSPSLFNPIKTKAEVAYVKDDGTVGFKFLALNSESQAALVEYIKTFEMQKAA
jgi:hypothetical protein